MSDHQEVVEYMLSTRPSIFVLLDGTDKDVCVPSNCRRDGLVLQIGFHMTIPIPDLRVSAHGFACTLSFARAPFEVFVPWRAVYAVHDTNNYGKCWREPPAHAATSVSDVAPKPTTKKKLPSYLRVVK